MAEPKKCRQCGGTFLYTTNDDLCFSCIQKNELEFQKIKNFLKEHPRSSVALISTTLDISVATIQKFIDEGRLEMVDKIIIDD
ncbi:MerR family transcriptional regulator [Ruminiclostridium herbifermentans]|uniref:MerR family transcriptional regulator n=1 Tax=Ruminiclostridium herbifermentans TaxID=2488810 RepID=A0A4U7JGT8_9FIRM|nr:MerR family transcriptional regulator [Ruminiclostridium herbifermentans]QNU67199.1 MerR family transcriptional regulator [Ruminiclostridium herbifermentans]